MKIAVFEGDGIGPEIVSASCTVLEQLDDLFSLGLDIRTHPIGLMALREMGTTFPAESIAAARNADAIVLGPLSTSEYPAESGGGINASAFLRRELDLFANIRPCRAFPGIDAKCPAMDLVVVRENTEGFYANRIMHAGSGEFAPEPDMAFALRRITARCSSRIARRAFELAGRRRQKVTAIHKANVLKLTDGLFLRECRTIAQSFPGIAYEELIVDAAASKLVFDEGELDVVVTTNLFGDILSNQAAALSGGLGLGASINHGDRHAMAQASHGSAPDIAGRGIANPASMLLSIALLLRHLGESRFSGRHVDAAEALEAAVQRTFESRATMTADIGGTSSTADVAEAVSAGLCEPEQKRLLA
ncbi:MAG: isocitrate/isopropylmalate dehydrogenase family protein [Rhizobiaceae bacterium]|nr:isocitrate/isopropylmalate dehydrogenase family protein [Rhizobiaceae bacterium]